MSAAGAISHSPDCPPILPPESITDQKHATDCRIFMDSQIRYGTMKRAELERGWNRARMYDAGHHWIMPMRASGGGRLWFAWEPIRLGVKDAKFPMPKRPIFSAAIQDEVARIIGVGSKPYVRVDDPEKSEGALLGKKVLLDRNEKAGWDRQNRLGAYHAAMFGQWIQESYWDTTRLKTTRGPVLEAVSCTGPEGCNTVYAHPNLSRDQADYVRASASNPLNVHEVVDTNGGATQYQLKGCPTCNRPLQPERGLSPDVFNKQLDAVGRPLFKDRPLGEDLTRTLSPYSFFPANQGIGYQTDEDMPSYAIRELVPVDFLKSRYQNGDLIKPSKDPEMFRHHPVVTAMGVSYSMEAVWEKYVAWDRYYAQPTMEFPNGRCIEMAGPVLLYDGDRNIPGTDIPRAEVRLAQWELREGEVWGKSLAEDLFSVQDNINSGLSQAMDIQQKWTNPKMILHEGMHLDFNGGGNSRYAGDVWTVNARGLPEEVQRKYPYTFGNTGAPGSLWQMFDRDKDHVAIISGARDAEVGNVSGVELNYSALVFAAQKSAERRKPRNDGIRQLKRHIWTHRLRLVAGLYREKRLIHYRDDSNKEQVKKLRGIALMDQTDVGLEDEPVIDSAIAERASIEQGLKNGTLKTSMTGGTFATDRKINRAIGVPETLSQERNVQEDHALDEWRSWITDGAEPFIDQQSDDHMIHLQTHVDSLASSRESKDLKDAMREAGTPWSWYLKVTWEWERLHADLLNRADALRNAPTPQMLQEQGAPQQMMQKAMGQLQMLQQSLGAWPSALELQILEVWKRLIVASDPSGRAWQSKEAQRLIRFKAHHLATWKLVQAALAPPMPVAPGAPGPKGPGGPPPPAGAAAAPPAQPMAA